MAATCAAFEAELLALTPGTAVANYITNPSFETNTTGWNTGAGDTITRDAADGQAGTACGLAVNDGSAAPGEGPFFDTGAVLTAGLIYTFSVYVRGAVGGEAVNLELMEKTAAGAQIGANSYGGGSILTTSWKRISVTRGFSTGVRAQVRVRSNTAAAMSYKIDGAMLVEGVSTGYVDGATPGYSWSGSAHASTTLASVPTFLNSDRGLMQGANARLRDAYLRGMADPLAHQYAKADPRVIQALYDNSKLASFDAITAP